MSETQPEIEIAHPSWLDITKLTQWKRGTGVAVAVHGDYAALFGALQKQITELRDRVAQLEEASSR